MRISEIRIQNLRGYRDETIPLSDYTCLVGANGAGKSTILCALCIFFRDTEHFATNLHSLQQEDFHCSDTTQPITITVTFTDLSAEAQEEFKEYYRQGKLVVTALAEFNTDTGTADVRQYGQRLVLKAFRAFFAAYNDNKKVDYLKEKYEEIRQHFSDLPPAGTKAQMHEALRAYEDSHPQLLELVASKDEFYGFSSGKNRLEKFVQWVYVPAVKDVTTEQTESKTTSLGKLLARTVRNRVDFSEPLAAIRSEMTTKYLNLLGSHQESLEELSTTLRDRLKDWAHPDARVRLEWRGLPEKAIRVDEPVAQIVAGEGKFDGHLSRFGHGLQRCYLLALLQELSGNDDSSGPRLILACEEPELHQHPPQARHLADVLYQLSRRNSQVFVSTHSPYFVSGSRFADVRIIRKDGSGCARVTHVTMEQLADTIADARQCSPSPPDAMALKMQQALLPTINEIFFTRVVVLVEGMEDVAYITAYFHLLDLWEEFRRHGCHLVATDRKSNILHPLAITKRLGIPAFVVFDSDAHVPDNGSGNRTQHERDNRAILRMRGYASQDPLPSDTFWEHDTVMWNAEIGRVVRSDMGGRIDAILERTRARFGNEGGVEKSVLFISEVMTEAWRAGLQSPSLERLCNSILDFARKSIARAAE